MKIFFTASFLLSILHISAQSSFENTVAIIQNKVSCCSVPFSPSTKRKVSNIGIEKNGDISLYYSDKKAKEAFNLFELYKEESITGIDTILGGKFIQFHIKSDKIRTIRFASPNDANQAYIAFLKLFDLCKKNNSEIKRLNLLQTIQYINDRLAKWADPKTVKLDAKANGDLVISNSSKQTFSFNFFDLNNNNSQKASGIEIIPCDKKSHAPVSWIHFKTSDRQIAFIRLNCNIPTDELEQIHSAILHLGSICQKPEVRKSNNDKGSYFLTRAGILSSNNEMLYRSLRPIDKMDIGDSTITITSKGEGWLDKDSFPVGNWNFYAINEAGEEYLFKSGVYQRTNPLMFQVINIDSSDLQNQFHLKFLNLQEEQVQTIPFIKINKWNYYHVNKKLWKSVYYKALQIPISTTILMTGTEVNSPPRLIVQFQDDRDEYIDGEIKEFDKKGKLFKIMQYNSSAILNKKILFDNVGNIIKEETAKPYQSPISPNNY